MLSNLEIMLMNGFEYFHEFIKILLFFLLLFIDDDKFELAVVNPSMVIGPIFGKNVSTSVEVRRYFNYNNIVLCGCSSEEIQEFWGFFSFCS